MLSLNSYEYLTLAETEKFSEKSIGYFAWKEKQSLLYMNASQSICEMLQLTSLKEAIGYTDADFKLLPGGHTHEYFNLIDRQVLNGKLYSNQCELILVANSSGQVVSRILEVSKRQVMHNGKCFGLAFEAIDITSKIIPTLKSSVETINDPLTPSFSPREISCIRLLLSGYSYQSIGEKLYLSSRTIEYHMDKLKHRLKCRNKQELIQKLLHMGFKPYF
ncbi:MAG: helix-turn-helix transcriptional regulator [Gammaproteobacteria bacterium]|jgi:DNA-binding CsgD family transcriptional regulator